eukprot:8515872-Pyramimonas_sp.AAC.1
MMNEWKRSHSLTTLMTQTAWGDGSLCMDGLVRKWHVAEIDAAGNKRSMHAHSWTRKGAASTGSDEIYSCQRSIW